MSKGTVVDKHRRIVTPVPKPYCRGCLGVPMGGNDDLILVIGWGRLCSRCALKNASMTALRALPPSEKMKFRLSEIGVAAMREILEKDGENDDWP